jgi:DNA-binding transcriptional LysR family regulator
MSHFIAMTGLKLSSFVPFSVTMMQMIDDFGEIRIRDLVLFDRVATLGSITAAALEMGVPKASASRWLAALEDRVGHSLVHRTTRQRALTERGEAFHARVRDVLVAVRAARIAAQSDEPGGTIRVSVPVPFGRIVAGPVIAGFRRDLPGVRLEIRLSNERVDLLRDRFDLAIRGGPLPDSDLIARRLAEVPMWLYASTRYRNCEHELIPVIAAPGDRGCPSPAWSSTIERRSRTRCERARARACCRHFLVNPRAPRAS